MARILLIPLKMKIFFYSTWTAFVALYLCFEFVQQNLIIDVYGFKKVNQCEFNLERTFSGKDFITEFHFTKDKIITDYNKSDFFKSLIYLDENGLVLNTENINSHNSEKGTLIEFYTKKEWETGLFVFSVKNAGELKNINLIIFDEKKNFGKRWVGKFDLIANGPSSSSFEESGGCFEHIFVVQLSKNLMFCKVWDFPISEAPLDLLEDKPNPTLWRKRNAIIQFKYHNNDNLRKKINNDSNLDEDYVIEKDNDLKMSNFFRDGNNNNEGKSTFSANGSKRNDHDSEGMSEGRKGYKIGFQLMLYSSVKDGNIKKNKCVEATTKNDTKCENLFARTNACVSTTPSSFVKISSLKVFKKSCSKNLGFLSGTENEDTKIMIDKNNLLDLLRQQEAKQESEHKSKQYLNNLVYPKREAQKAQTGKNNSQKNIDFKKFSLAQYIEIVNEEINRIKDSKKQLNNSYSLAFKSGEKDERGEHLIQKNDRAFNGIEEILLCDEKTINCLARSNLKRRKNKTAKAPEKCENMVVNQSIKGQEKAVEEKLTNNVLEEKHSHSLLPSVGRRRLLALEMRESEREYAPNRSTDLFYLESLTSKNEGDNSSNYLPFTDYRKLDSSLLSPSPGILTSYIVPQAVSALSHKVEGGKNLIGNAVQKRVDNSKEIKEDIYKTAQSVRHTAADILDNTISPVASSSRSGSRKGEGEDAMKYETTPFNLRYQRNDLTPKMLLKNPQKENLQKFDKIYERNSLYENEPFAHHNTIIRGSASSPAFSLQEHPSYNANMFAPPIPFQYLPPTNGNFPATLKKEGKISISALSDKRHVGGENTLYRRNDDRRPILDATRKNFGTAGEALVNLVRNGITEHGT